MYDESIKRLIKYEEEIIKFINTSIKNYVVFKSTRVSSQNEGIELFLSKFESHKNYNNLKEKYKISNTLIQPKPDKFRYINYKAEVRDKNDKNLPEDVVKKIVLFIARQFNSKKGNETVSKDETQNQFHNKDEKKIQKFVDDAWNGEVILDNQKNTVNIIY